MFDQQPIEVAAMADACARAYAVTGDSTWRDGVELRSVGWFLGANDVGVPMCDPSAAPATTASRPTASTSTRAPSRPSR